jgi:hypothetical protein
MRSSASPERINGFQLLKPPVPTGGFFFANPGEFDRAGRDGMTFYTR